MNRNLLPDGKSLICLITEGDATAENFFEKKTAILNLIKAATDAKISFVQIREKKLTARFVFELVAASVKITLQSETKILVNDRADVALAAGAAGVQLTGVSLSAETIRRHFPPNFIVGVSAHTLEDVENAQKAAADFATFSPIFPTASKEKYGAPQGLEKLREVCERVKDFPVVALGGIDKDNFQSVLENGARGFAAIRFLNDAENLRKLAAQLGGGGT